MQNRCNRVLGLLLVVGMGPVHAAAPAIGFFGEIHGNAYWQSDSSKRPVRDLDELGENSKLVLLKGSKLTVLYLQSGQQYELVGPALVQFKIHQPIALNGAPPKKLGTASVIDENKIHVDPKNVQGAGKTLVSTDSKKAPDQPVMAAAPTPAPPPPAYVPVPPIMAAPVTQVAASESSEEAEKQTYADALAAREAEMATARQAETEVAAARRAEDAAAAKARQTAEADAAAKASGCYPVESDPEKEEQSTELESKVLDEKARDCPMITF